MDRTPFASPLNINLNLDLAAERKAADSWMRLTFNLPAETDLSGLGPLASDPRIIRGKELWDLGEYEDGHLEFEDLRNSISTDAVSTYRLANYLLDIGDYFSGITAARRVLTLAGHKEKWQNVMQYATDALDYYCKWYGAYPYSTLTVCDGSMAAGGGMEYPNLVIISSGEDKITRTLEMAVIHEIGHQW